MDLREIVQFIVFVVLGRTVSALTVNMDSIVHFSQENNIITLNCSYHLDRGESMRDRDIRWQKKIGNEFKKIATFSPPGGQEPFFEPDMQDFYKNRTELIAPNNNSSLSAVMIIRNSECTDEGMYQCEIEYFIGGSKKEIGSSFVEFSAKAREPEQFLVLPNELEEGESITLICSADIGSPLGNIQMWKKHHIKNTYELIYTSNTTNNRTENCTDLINVTTTYTVTRKDNGALFWCSSQNNLTKDPVPSRESSKITVIYGPGKSTITLTPTKMVYSVGDPLIIQCTTDSNPPPAFTWSFRPYNESEEMTIIEHSNITAKLVFDRIQIKNTGTYTCTVINTARPNNPNMSSFVCINVKQSGRIYTGCDHCTYIETCQQSNERTVCNFNIWVPITVIFILLSVAFVVSSSVLIMKWKTTHKSTTNKKLVEMRCPPYDVKPEENNGGYISPLSLECHPYDVTPENHGGYISPVSLEFECSTPSLSQEKNGGLSFLKDLL